MGKSLLLWKLLHNPKQTKLTFQKFQKFLGDGVQKEGVEEIEGEVVVDAEEVDGSEQ